MAQKVQQLVIAAEKAFAQYNGSGSPAQSVDILPSKQEMAAYKAAIKAYLTKNMNARATYNRTMNLKKAAEDAKTANAVQQSAANAVNELLLTQAAMAAFEVAKAKAEAKLQQNQPNQ
jgi:hypothetical protein